jgi:hypothetical protein
VGGGGGALHASSYQQPPSNSKEVVNELGQKAAKALQSSTNWFMKASRTLVTQVQQRLDGTVGGSGGAAAGGSAGACLARSVCVCNIACRAHVLRAGGWRWCSTWRAHS